jgi:AcrR family transcriptional regulator
MAERLDRDDWVCAGVAALSDGGVSAVRVEPLARRLGVTKGSFYWHFADRDALLAAIIAAWAQRQTQAVIDEVAAAGPAEPLARLTLLSRIVGRLDIRLEAAVRTWALTDPRAAAAVARIDAARQGYLQEIIESAGVPDDVAAGRARLLYYALIGQIVSAPPGWPRLHRQAMELNLELFLRWP